MFALYYPYLFAALTSTLALLVEDLSDYTFMCPSGYINRINGMKNETGIDSMAINLLQVHCSDGNSSSVFGNLQGDKEFNLVLEDGINFVETSRRKDPNVTGRFGSKVLTGIRLNGEHQATSQTTYDETYNENGRHNSIATRIHFFASCDHISDIWFEFDALSNFQT